MKGLLVTYLLTYGGAAAALFNPFLGVCIYWIFDIVRPQYMFAWAGTQGSFSEVIAIGTMAGWIFKGGGNWRFGRGRVVVLLFAAYCVWVVFSAASASNQSVALNFVEGQAKRALMFAIAVTLADSHARLIQLAWVLVGSAGYLALEMNQRYLGGFNEVAQGYGGMDNNSIAISLVTCLGPAVFLGLYAKKRWHKAVALGSAALIGHTVLLTFSRGGLLGMLAAAAAALVFGPKRPRHLLAMVVAIGLGLQLAGPEVRARFATAFAENSERDSSAQSRLDLWMDCVEVMKKYPILGIGPDHFPLVAAEFGWPDGKEAHSLWFQMGAEVGIPGMLFLIAFYVTAIWRLRRGAISRPVDGDRWTHFAALMVITSLVGFAVSAQFVTMEGLETPLYVAVIAVGTLRLAPRSSAAAATTRTGRFPLVPGPVLSPARSGVTGAALNRRVPVIRRS
jgi:probable O-glycosylation ligase (exosortase A-associated)